MDPRPAMATPLATATTDPRPATPTPATTDTLAITALLVTMGTPAKSGQIGLGPIGRGVDCQVQLANVAHYVQSVAEGDPGIPGGEDDRCRWLKTG
jgi:hypothetical protein